MTCSKAVNITNLDLDESNLGMYLYVFGSHGTPHKVDIYQPSGSMDRELYKYQVSLIDPYSRFDSDGDGTSQVGGA